MTHSRSLYQAAATGDIAVARVGLMNGISIDGDAIHQAQTPLHAAAAHGQVAMIDWLLDHGATKNPYAADAGLPLHLAAKTGHTAAVRVLLYRGADVRSPDPGGRLASDLAREHGHAALADELDDFLRNDVGPDWMGAISSSAAEADAYFRGHPDQLNRSRYHGHSPLGWAAHLGDRERVRTLLELGAILTPEAAIVMGEAAFVKEWVTRHPLRINARSIEARDLPLLYFAAIVGDLSIAEFLLEHGADINSGHKKGSTVLYHAVEFGQSGMVRFLIRHGADVNKASHYGLAPLHVAAHRGSLEIAQLLITAGANPAARTLDGETILDAARAGGNGDLIHWLEEIAQRPAV